MIRIEVKKNLTKNEVTLSTEVSSDEEVVDRIKELDELIIAYDKSSKTSVDPRAAIGTARTVSRR
jgi:hypothetical protein